ncbi:hypothetical protein [Paenibacillus sp. FSL H7-0331]|uniref:hypothetical protein n=1 Tax=Paenibacillus sp. FSL H7-0331 TaxID=1920421 RepID=UPI00096C6313|nr:hypothetical protein [Paenibacillus sp. FSL H7-0331]OMF00836.1 hypothetical protein BK127_37970 [Paenibacillus sp. FSL H7-0331]
MKLKKSVALSSLVLSTVLLFNSIAPVSAQSIVDPQSKETVESFTIETMSTEKNADGLYVVTGYKNVDSIMKFNTREGKIILNVSMVKDYYDTNGNFVKTVIKDEGIDNNLVTGEAEKLVSNITENLAPKTLKSKKAVSSATLSENDKKKIKESIQNEVNNLPKEKPVKTIGFTESHLLEIKEKVKELQLQKQKNDQTMGINSVLMKGAYDNYYNYDLTSGSFVVQALSAQAHKYIKYTGSTIGSTKNSNSMTSYMSYINNYEDAIVAGMAGPNSWEVAGWVTAIVSFTTFVVGVAGGPAGWLSQHLLLTD